MRQVYICEKCGKQYDNWDDAYKCERTHAEPLLLDGFDLCENSEYANKVVHYAEGESIPDLITLRFHEYDDNGDTLTDENGVDMFRIVQFAPVNKQDRKLLGNLYEDMHERQVERKRENDEWTRQWLAEQAEKKRKAEEEAQAQQEQQDEVTDSIEVTSLEVHED